MLVTGEPELVLSLDRSGGWNQTTSVCFLFHMSLVDDESKKITSQLVP